MPHKLYTHTHTHTTLHISAVSLYILDRNSYSTASEKPMPFPGKNPYKGKKRIKDEDKISPELKEKFVEQILDLVLYDVENCAALRNFDVIQQNTHCTFAKRSMLWGSHDYDTSMTLGKLYYRYRDTVLMYINKLASF